MHPHEVKYQTDQRTAGPLDVARVHQFHLNFTMEWDGGEEDLFQPILEVIETQIGGPQIERVIVQSGDVTVEIDGRAEDHPIVTAIEDLKDDVTDDVSVPEFREKLMKSLDAIEVRAMEEVYDG